MKGIGRQISLGIAKEAVRGTAETGATFWLPWTDLSVDEKDERAIDDQAVGLLESSVGEKIVSKFAELSLKGNIGDKSFILLLLSQLGTLSTGANADASGNVKDHTLNVAQNAQHQSLTLFADDPIGAQDYKHALGCSNTLELNYEQGKFVKYGLTMKGKKGVTATLTPSFTAENQFLPQHLTFKLAANVAGLAAASALPIRSLKLKITKKLEAQNVLGNVEPVDFLVKGFDIEGEFDLIYQNESDAKTASLLDTAKAMRIDLKNTDVVIGTAANPEIKIDLYSVNLQPISRQIKGGDIVYQNVPFKAHLSLSDSKMVQIVATNLQASY